MNKKSPTLQMFKASSLNTNKRCNIFHQLLAREYDTTLSSQRRVHYITGTLITKGSCHLKKVWTHTSSQRIGCDGQYIFGSNYQDCYDCGHFPVNGKFKAKFKLKREKYEKILHGVLMDSVSESVSLPYQGHRTSLFGVTKNRHLLRVDVETGATLEKVSLGPPSVKFQKIHWNQIDETLVISSILYPKTSVRNIRQAARDVTDVIQLIVMSCMPLDFVCKMSVTNKVFGRHVVDASISLDLLMVTHSSGHIHMYSFPALLQQSRTHSHQLYDVMPDGTSFGCILYPLTHNINIEECPPCLLEVRCRYRDVMITMPPCHYLMWPVDKKSPGYCCYSVRTNKMVENGCLPVEEDSLEEEKITLHADDSGRIILINDSHLKMYKLVPVDGSDDRALVEDFTIDCGSAQKAQSLMPNITQSGRIIKKRLLPETCDLSLKDQTVLSVMYSEDLDMIVILTIRNEGCIHEQFNGATVVGFYDNWSGKLLRQFELHGAPVDEADERFFTFDYDTVTHIFKKLNGKMECHVYKFVMDVQSQEMEILKGKQTERRQSKSSRRSLSRR